MVVLPDPNLGAPADRILLVLGQTPFPVELLDRNYHVLYCNIAYAQTFLEAPATVLDQETRVFPEVFPDGRTRQEVLNQAQTDGIWKGEVKVVTAVQTTLAVRLSVFPIRNPGSAQAEFAVFYEDISQEIETREALVHQQNLVAIRSRQAQMGELLSMIAHQWRQPLTVVMSLIGNIQLKAQMGGVDPEYLKTKLERMAQTITFLSETIDSFRNFYAPSKFRAAEDIGHLTRKALELVSPSLQKMGVQVELSFPAEPLVARVFGGELLQVALELINNARDALGSAVGQNPVLKLGVFREGSMVSLRVENNGDQIPPSVLPHIYDPYFTTKEGASGTGLGLYMAKIIVENHHKGNLSAVSGDGWTVFTCSIPMDGTP